MSSICEVFWALETNFPESLKLMVDKTTSLDIIETRLNIANTKKRTSKMRKIPERTAYAGSSLIRKHLKTSSEWL